MLVLALLLAVAEEGLEAMVGSGALAVGDSWTRRRKLFYDPRHCRSKGRMLSYNA